MRADEQDTKLMQGSATAEIRARLGVRGRWCALCELDRPERSASATIPDYTRYMYGAGTKLEDGCTTVCTERRIASRTRELSMRDVESDAPVESVYSKYQIQSRCAESWAGNNDTAAKQTEERKLVQS